MGVEDEIGQLLQQGWTPKQLIDQNRFRKSTVYKVADSLRSLQGASPAPLWSVVIDPGRDRFLPGETAVLACTVVNQSAADLYIFQAGVQPEWLVDQWIYALQRRLLRPGESVVIRLSVAIPGDLRLGEKDLMFGIQGQWVGPATTMPASGIMWAGPTILRVQHPLSGKKIFISHSVRDMSPVNQLASTLDDFGIEPIVAEALVSPGAAMTDRSAALIQQCEVVVALLTHDSIRTPWVLAEIDYAARIGKPLVPLRDRSLRQLGTPADQLNWIDIDLSLGIDAITSRVFDALKALPQARRMAKNAQPKSDDAFAVLGIAILAFVVGVAVSKGGGGGLR